MYDWSEYYNSVGTKPNTIVERILPFVVGRDAALDLGSGNFRDSKFLLDEGFQSVVAVDSFDYPHTSVPGGIEFTRRPLELYIPEPSTYDLIICCNSTCYLKKPDAVKLMAKVYAGLKTGGVFVANFLGENDAWVRSNRRNTRYSWFSELEMRAFERRFGSLILEDKDGTRKRNVGVEKHQHIWNFAFRKK